MVDALLAGDEHHYLERECRPWRGRVHLAGGRLELALADAEAAHALAEEARDSQDLHPTRAFPARSLSAGRRDEAAAVADRLLSGSAAACSTPTWVPTSAWSWGNWASRRPRSTGSASRRRRGWRRPGRWAGGDPLAAADAYAAIGSLPDEADARLAAACSTGRAARRTPCPAPPRRGLPRLDGRRPRLAFASQT